MSFKKSSLILVLNTERNAFVHTGFERIWDKTVVANFESLSLDGLLIIAYLNGQKFGTMTHYKLQSNLMHQYQLMLKSNN